MDAQTRAAVLRVWEQQVRAHGDLVRGAVEALEQVNGEGEGGFEALKGALIEATARRISRTLGETSDWADLAREAGVSVGR
jgi:hypothetical protein